MGVKVATGCLNLSPQTLASAISSPCRRNLTSLALLYRPAMFGTKLSRSPLFDMSRKHHPIKRAVAAAGGLSSEFSDEEFSRQILELAHKFQLSDNTPDVFEPNPFTESTDWPPEDMIPATIERKANCVDLPFSLRIIKRKKQWEEGFKEAGESACCSVKKAFSSMVFIIREIQSYSLQMRELLFFEDLQGILVRVQKEMNDSFVWLFRQVFSQTPTLMVYVMILLANYSVHSMSSHLALAAAPPVAAVEIVSTTEYRSQSQTKFDSSSSGGKTTSVGGINGGGGKFRRVASGTDGDGDSHRGFVSDGASLANPTRGSEESVSGRVTREEETDLWDFMVDESDRMMIGDGGFDRETMKRFVSPVTVKIEEEDTEHHFKTELLYQTGLSQEPDNPLLLANYAQFLFLVAHDYDRAEEYFKRATKVEPKDAEALSKYASFLWRARNDLWAAEETYLEAISADPTNSYYAANYAHFLWTTGGEDTCFPLDSPENIFSDDV